MPRWVDNVPKRIRRFILLIPLCTVLACGTTQDERNKEQAADSKDVRETPAKPTPAGQKISPNHCRIVGTVVEIDSAPTTAEPDNPCSLVPCRALVRVDEIIGYGQGFSSPLAKGVEVKVDFRFTLSPTKDLFPKMKTSYPGLRVGSSFLADLEEQMSEKTDERQDRFFAVYGYKAK